MSEQLQSIRWHVVNNTVNKEIIVGLVDGAIDSHARLLRCIDMAMGCLDPDSSNPDERLAWYRLYDAEMGREPRKSLRDYPVEP